MFSSVKLDNASRNPQRNPSITSLAFHKGELYVAGMTTQEWESNLKAIPFPFSEATTKGAGVQIYHGAHGAWETRAPIQTFMAYDIAGQTHLLASYTCTPLVKIPVSELKPGAKVKGTTIAELGNGNQPLDMIAYTKGGKDYLLTANTRHGVLKIPTAEFATAAAINNPVTGGGTAGVKAEKITELEGVVQLDKFDAERVIILVQTKDGFNLKTIPVP